ncbi:MAG TPA: ATP-binding protein, partial [Opitutaceae bacterium]|nr:ATP-binding protein [Opitutaceae bacterium]
KVTVVPIVDGGTISLWSDGVEDLAASLGVDPFGLTLGLRRSIASGQRHPEFLRGARDDIMSIVVRTDVDPTTSVNDEIILRQTLRGNTESQINEYQEFWARTLSLALPDLSEAARYAILLCTREAVLNALKHGCKGSANHAVLLEISLQPDLSRVQVYICDPGEGHTFDLDTYEPQASADMLTEHRGLILISHLCDQLISERNGAELTLLFNLNPESASDLPSHATALQSGT